MKTSTLLAEWWPLIMAAGAALAIAYIRVRNYLRLSKEEQSAAVEKHKEAITKAIRDMLLYWITEAEKDLGAETGRLKLRAVYSRILDKWPEAAEIITLDQLDRLVQAPLEELRKTLESNQSWTAYVNGIEVTKE